MAKVYEGNEQVLIEWANLRFTFSFQLERGTRLRSRSVCENDFVVVIRTQAMRVVFIRLLTVELHWRDKEKTGLPDLPIKSPVKIAK